MFKELAPYLRQRAVLLTVTHLEEDRIRVNVIPQKIEDGENAALTTPLSVTGTADELDRELPSTLVNFVSAHLQLKNTLERAKEEMDAAAKTAQAEARTKARTLVKREVTKPVAEKPAVTPKAVEPEPVKTASLFDMPISPTNGPAPNADVDEEDEILAEAAEDDPTAGDDELNEAA